MRLFRSLNSKKIKRRSVGEYYINTTIVFRTIKDIEFQLLIVIILRGLMTNIVYITL